MKDALQKKNIVLYAEDDVDDVELVTEVFSKHSQNVRLVTVSDGFEALSFLKNLGIDEPSPCLIILDINMPRLDGKEALLKLRRMERFNEVPVILFSTSSQPVDQQFAEAQKAGFLTKPLKYDQMDVIANQFIDYCSEEVKNNIRKINKK